LITPVDWYVEQVLLSALVILVVIGGLGLSVAPKRKGPTTTYAILLKISSIVISLRGFPAANCLAASVNPMGYKPRLSRVFVHHCSVQITDRAGTNETCVGLALNYNFPSTLP
jgi:hypothetical protein